MICAILACENDESDGLVSELDGKYLGRITVYDSEQRSQSTEETLEIIEAPNETLELRFQSDEINGIDIQDYRATIENKFSGRIMDSRLDHYGQVSLDGDSLIVIVSDRQFGDKILQYYGVKD